MARIVWMHVKLVQMHRLIQQMHNRKGNRLVVRIDRHPDIFVPEIDVGGDQVIIGEIGVWRRTKHGCGGSLNHWQRSKVILACSSDATSISHRRGSRGLSVGRDRTTFWAHTT